jgi:amidase
LTAAELQKLLTSGAITSCEVVKQCLKQIDKHNHQGLELHAILSVQSHAELLRRAQLLDDERKQGNTRGPLHGVPIILKDICATLDMPSTGGSHAFKKGHAKIDAPLIRTLNDAGMIIIAKANLSVGPSFTSNHKTRAYFASRSWETQKGTGSWQDGPP